MTIEMLIQIALGLGVGGVLVAIVNGLMNRRKIRAEANSTDMDSTNTVFQMQRTHLQDADAKIKSLTERVDAVEMENLSLTRSVRVLQSTTWEQHMWITRVFTLLTPEQKERVGEPPAATMYNGHEAKTVGQ